MKKILIISLLTVSLFAWGKDKIKTQAREEAQSICIAGFLFAITTVHNGSGTGVSITQIFREGLKDNYPNRPIKCNNHKKGK